MGHLDPTFKAVFKTNWFSFPTALSQHYANRPFTRDVVTMKGTVDIKMSAFMKASSPLLTAFGTLIPFEGKQIPTTVYAKSQLSSDNYIMERHFNPLHLKSYIFRSVLSSNPGKYHDHSRILELFKYGIGSLANYTYNDQSKTINITHHSYVLNLYGYQLRLPLEWLFGEVSAEEVALDDNRFRMKVSIIHKVFGLMYEYHGQFEVTDVYLDKL